MVSVRQASGLPIEGEAGVGYLLRPGFDLPNVTFIYDQVDALAAGLSYVENTGDPARATAARVRKSRQACLDPRNARSPTRRTTVFTTGAVQR